MRFLELSPETSSGISVLSEIPTESVSNVLEKFFVPAAYKMLGIEMVGEEKVSTARAGAKKLGMEVEEVEKGIKAVAKVFLEATKVGRISISNIPINA